MGCTSLAGPARSIFRCRRSLSRSSWGLVSRLYRRSRQRARHRWFRRRKPWRAAGVNLRSAWNASAMRSSPSCLRRWQQLRRACPPSQDKPLFGYLAAVLLIGASSLAIPTLVYSVTASASVVMNRFMGVEAMLASRSLAGSLRRTSVLVGALSTAIAMMTSVGIMVGSFRQTVVTWMDNELPADLYLRPAGDPAADRHPTIDPNLAERIARVPGVESVSRFRAYEIDYQGLPVTLAGADFNPNRPRDFSNFLSGRAPARVLDEMKATNGVLVSEPFAYKHHVRAGDSISLPLGGKMVSFRIVDIFYDYGNERGYILIDRADHAAAICPIRRRRTWPSTSLRASILNTCAQRYQARRGPSRRAHLLQSRYSTRRAFASSTRPSPSPMRSRLSP